MNNEIKLEDLDKVESINSAVIPSLTVAQASQIVSMIFKVKKADYVPQNVQLRASISPFIFTANVKLGDLESLEKDSEIESISFAQKLDLDEKLEQ